MRPGFRTNFRFSGFAIIQSIIAFVVSVLAVTLFLSRYLIDELITEGEGHGYTIGMSKQQAFETAADLYIPGSVELSVPGLANNQTNLRTIQFDE